MKSILVIFIAGMMLLSLAAVSAQSEKSFGNKNVSVEKNETEDLNDTGNNNVDDNNQEEVNDGEHGDINEGEYEGPLESGYGRLRIPSILSGR